MRTFAHHETKHALHGITVVVETDGPELWVGRCDDIVAEGVILKDADVHREGEGPRPRHAWLERAKQLGVHPNFRLTRIDAARVVSVRRLTEI
jgi:hypothetical protein